jgi:osmoprotectant transport system ATP-binding protein
MFRLEQANKSFGSTRALGPLSHDFAANRTTALIGPSGCGKSTLLKLLIGLSKPDSGCVYFDGRALTESSLPELRRQVGYVIQDGGLFPHLTARGNLSLMAGHLGWSSASIAVRIGELIELTRFPADALERFPGELSGGQNQRVSLMRALMLDPVALLLDEPLGALDPMIRFDLQRDLAGIFSELNKTVVLVTHDLTEAAYLADQVLLLADGLIAQQGSIDDLFDHPANEFVRRFTQAQSPYGESGRAGR